MSEENGKIKDNVQMDTSESYPAAAPAADPAESERLFTAEEVSAIVQKRLERERQKAAKAADNAEKCSDNAEHAELIAKAARLECLEYVLSAGISPDILDIIDTKDVEAFKVKADKLKAMNTISAYPIIRDGGEVIKRESDPNAGLKEAFSRKAKHKPKEFNPYG